MAKHDKWVKTFSYFADGNDVFCPNCGSHKLKDAYIDLGEQRGWGAFWCENCLEAFWLSRVKLTDERLRQKVVPALPIDLKFV